MSNLRINLDDLLHARTVESERIEFKATWDPRVTGHQVLKTICAFANDLRRHGSGYVILGVAEKDGRAELPPPGLTARQIDDATKWLKGRCQRIEPRYHPIFSAEEKDGKRILAIWAPASENPPHQAPDGDKGPKKYWVRIDRETVDAQSRGLLNQLHAQSATVPWDSRTHRNATIDDLSETLVREHLRACDSALLHEPDARAIYRKMDIVRRVNDHEVPRNVALLFFSRDPTRWFSGAKVEVSIMRTGTGGDAIGDKEFRGGIADQVRDCLHYLRSEVIGSEIRKVPNRLRADRSVSYPEEAIREILVNALFHRRYADDSPHSTFVRVTSDRIDIRSTPGPVPGIEFEQLRRGGTPRLVPPRNPRVGELFKELGMAEKRLSGLGKVYEAMERNGSPPPDFHFDEGRTFFQATLFAHMRTSTRAAIRKADELRAVGRADAAADTLEAAWRVNPGSSRLAEELVRQCVTLGDLDRAEPLIESVLAEDPGWERAYVVVPWLEALVADGQRERAHRLLREWATKLSPREAIGAAILARRLRDADTAALLFDVAGTLILDDPRALLESAQNKLWLAGHAHRDRLAARNQELLRDARILLERLLRMDAPRRRHAWAWRELGRARRWLGEPDSSVDDTYANAVELAPDEASFRAEWGRASERGALALLEWQHEQMGDLRAPEHLLGPRVLGDAEYAKQDAALQAVERAVDKLKASLSDCIAEPDGRVRGLLEDLDRARSRLEHSGSRWMGTGLEVAKDLTQAIATRTDQPTEPPVNTTDSGRFMALLRDLADLNLRYLALLRPTR